MIHVIDFLREILNFQFKEIENIFVAKNLGTNNANYAPLIDPTPPTRFWDQTRIN